MILSVQIKGVLLTLAAVCFGVITGGIVKMLSGDLTLLSTLFFRYLFSLPILGLVAWRARGREMLHITQRRTMVIRVMFGLAGITFWFLSVRNIPLGQATALFQSSVLFITLASPLLLAEKVGIYRTMAVITGLLGILLLTDPFSQAVTPAVLFAVCGAMASAGLAITLRKLGKGDQPVTVAFVYNSIGFLVFSLMVLILPGQFVLPSLKELFMLVALGMFSSLLQLCFTTAYRYSEAVVVASLRYLQVPMAAIFGFLLFSEVPTAIQLCGMVVVVSSCMFIIWREFTISRQRAIDK
ncbi:MAG: DMT family transporter [Candidatus Puniceispirillaceae bacterium]|jgi:drug/metabolite transporter (DMT)-like permease